MDKILHFIDGQYSPSASDRWMYKINPATGEKTADIALGDQTDVQRAVDASAQALTSWSATSAQQRFEILNRIAEIISQRSEMLAAAETTDTGKPLRLSREVEIPRASSNFRFFATAALQFSSESHAMPSAINYTLRQPVGIVGCISPWNLPLYLFTWKIAPALAAGNCVVSKPSELSPTTASLLGQICLDAGLPPGVLNIIQGSGAQAGDAIVRHPRIKAVSFTGGTKTGQLISSIAGPMFKKLSLELGGKNPCLVFADCPMERTVSEVARLAFSNQGQICLCGSRILIQRSIYAEFKERLLAKISKLCIGDPMDPDTQFGSLISAEHQQKVLSYIALAQQEGGRILTGGHALQLQGRCSKGFFVAPTVIEGLGPSCRTNMEEIFGPVITLQPFDTEEEALQLANASEYGLAATLWTTDVDRVHRLSSRINTGIVWVNCWLLRDLRTPFGGVNASGVGREGGWEVMRFFTEAKNVCIQFDNNLY